MADKALCTDLYNLGRCLLLSVRHAEEMGKLT